MALCDGLPVLLGHQAPETEGREAQGRSGEESCRMSHQVWVSRRDSSGNKNGIGTRRDRAQGTSDRAMRACVLVGAGREKEPESAKH